MKTATRFATLLLAATAAGSFAQEPEATAKTNAIAEAVATPEASPSGGLQIDVGRTDSERVQLLLNVGSVYFKDKDYNSAVEAYERILEIDPLNKEARFIIGHVYISAKQYDKAEQLLSELVAEFPEDFQLRNNLAWLYATAEDPAYRNGAKAVKLAQEAMIIAPDDHHVWSTLSEAYYVSGQYEKAHRAIMQMVALVNKNSANVSQEMVDEYNEQIRKCIRAKESEEALKETEEAPAAAVNAEQATP